MSRPLIKTYGTVSAEQQKEMSGYEFVKGLVDGTLPLNMIAQTLGYDVTEAEKGRVIVTAEPTDAHLNPYGTVHGGLTATLLDSCMGLAVQSNLERGPTNDGRVQNFTDEAHHSGYRKDPGRGDSPELRSPSWYGRRTRHRQRGAAPGTWHDDVSDLREL